MYEATVDTAELGTLTVAGSPRLADSLPATVTSFDDPAILVLLAAVVVTPTLGVGDLERLSTDSRCKVLHAALRAHPVTRRRLLVEEGRGR